MKIIDGHELAANIKKAADKRRDSGLCILAGMVVGFVKDMQEAEAYTEAKKRIENMEKIIEDQQERIDIMAADMPIHCKDCRRYDPLAETCRWMGGLISPEFYCGNAEPKEDDEDADTSDKA